MQRYSKSVIVHNCVVDTLFVPSFGSAWNISDIGNGEIIIDWNRD